MGMVIMVWVKKKSCVMLWKILEVFNRKDEFKVLYWKNTWGTARVQDDKKENVIYSIEIIY